MPARLPRLAAALLVAAAICAAALGTTALLPATARADGDPASDVLLGENVFYPYTPTVSPAIQKTLDAEAAAASGARFPLKVALIASPVDLGVIPDLFGKPQQYANFLDQEISFQAKQPLLVVMSTGFGIQGLPAPARAALATLTKPAGGQTDDLARAAITAVAKLAAASGHPLSGVPGTPSKSSGGGSSTTIVLVALVVAALATAAALVAVRRRQAAA
jgi:hypothetical protein